MPSFFAARSQRLRSASVLRITVTRVFMLLPSRCIYDNYKPDSGDVYTQSDERLVSRSRFPMQLDEGRAVEIILVQQNQDQPPPCCFEALGLR